jgi:hypothetical protein
MKKIKECESCQVREDIHKTATGEKFKNNRCKGCQ